MVLPSQKHMSRFRK